MSKLFSMVQTEKSAPHDGGGRSLASRLRWLLLLLSAASLLSAAAFFARAPSALRTRRAAPLSASSNSTSSSNKTVITATNTSTSTTTNDIPRIIHQSWKSRDVIPERFAPWMRSWTRAHPAWTYVFWTDADNLALFEERYPAYAHVARAVDKIALADMTRYALLHSVGGLYVDADFECVQPFDRLARAHELFVSSEPRAHTVLLERSESVSLCNALLASRPGHPFWLALLDAIRAKFESEQGRDPVGLTGPRILNQTFFAHFPNASADSSAAVLPSAFFYPEVAYWNMATLERACRVRQDSAAARACAWLREFPHGEFTNDTHATHHWQCTWCNGDGDAAYSSLSEVFASEAHVVMHEPRISRDGVELMPIRRHSGTKSSRRKTIS